MIASTGGPCLVLGHTPLVAARAFLARPEQPMRRWKIATAPDAESACAYLATLRAVSHPPIG
jgi:hypothetical protein